MRVALMILAIDPGVHECACAWFTDAGVLQSTEFAAPDAVPVGGITRVVVVERPQYDKRADHARPEDLIGLTWAGARLAGYVAGHYGARIVELTPREWKGSEPKPLNHRRVWRVLTEPERACLGGDETHRRINAACEKGALKRWGISGAACYPRTWKMHNILDAVALGATHLGRLRKVG